MPGCSAGVVEQDPRYVVRALECGEMPGFREDEVTRAGIRLDIGLTIRGPRPVLVAVDQRDRDVDPRVAFPGRNQALQVAVDRPGHRRVSGPPADTAELIEIVVGQS